MHYEDNNDERTCCRGGPRSADHIDILSHESVLKDVLMMSAGHSASLHDQISSRIDSIVKGIPEL